MQQRRLEANKIYVLGLKDFVDRKQSKNTKIDEKTCDELRRLLMDHHNDRWFKLKLLKNVESRIYETEMMIARYQMSCFDLTQYDNDLFSIKLLIQKNKLSYRAMSEAKRKRFDLGLSRKAY